ncbi:MAG: tetratricopeptide repeat protein [Alphaproteobacteria bacterium]|nr:tetratricopeptide repeat protein [Alphaproteobacteria bacterium]
MRQGLAVGAQDHLAVAAVLAPTDADIMTELAAVLITGGQPAAARDILLRAIAQNPAHLTARCLLAEALTSLGQSVAAIKQRRLAHAVTFAGQQPAPLAATMELVVNLAALAGALINVGRLAEARALVESSLALRVDCAQAHVALARLHRSEGHLDEALATLRHATSLRPDLSAPYRLMAELAETRGDIDQAITLLFAASANAEAGTGAEADHVNVIDHRLGALLRRRQRRDDALATFRRILARTPDDVAALHGLSAVFRDLGRHDEALPFARRAVALSPGDPWQHVQLGNVLAGLNRPGDAVRAYRSAMALKHHLTGVHQALGRQLVITGDLISAAEAYSLAAAESPENTDLLMRTATLYQQAGRAAEAVPWFRRAIGCGVAAHASLGRALLTCNRWQEGLDLLTPLQSAQPLPTQPLLISSNGLTLEEEIALLGLAPRALAKGIRLILACSASLAPLLRTYLPKAEIVSGDAVSPPIGQPASWADVVRGLAGDAAETPLSVDPWLRRPPRNAPPASGKAPVLAVDRRGPRPLPDEVWTAILAERKGAVLDLGDVAENDLTGLCARLAEAEALLSGGGIAAHLAGAMGKPGVVVLGTPSSWPWPETGEATPWYPSLRLLRSTDGNDVPGAIVDVIRALGSGAAPKPAYLPVHLAGEAASEESHHTTLLDALYRLRLPPCGDDGFYTCDRLHGGMQNVMYRLTGPDNYVLRLGRFPASGWLYFGEERANSLAAYAAGIGPRIAYFDIADGTMLTHFVDGTRVNASNVNDAGLVRRVGRLYQHLHSLAPFLGNYDIFRLIDSEKKRLADFTDPDFADFAEMTRRVAEIRTLLAASAVSMAPCHNDPVPENFIDAASGATLIDWQCTGMADPHWEVGAFSAQCALTPEMEKVMFAAYFGDDNQRWMPRAVLYKVVCHYYWTIHYLARLKENPQDPNTRTNAMNSANGLRGALANSDLPRQIAASVHLGIGGLIGAP